MFLIDFELSPNEYRPRIPELEVYLELLKKGKWLASEGYTQDGGCNPKQQFGESDKIKPIFFI